MGYSDPVIVESDRSLFITKTYFYLIVAVLGFIGLECILFSSGLAESIAETLLGVSWMLVLGAFILVAWLASAAAHSIRSLPLQYLALAIYVVAEAIIFVPMLYMADAMAPGIIEDAAGLSIFGFVSLTVVAFLTRRNFSFLRSTLIWGGVFSLGLIIASVLFGFVLGSWFSVMMIIYACGAILYDTSNIIHEYDEDRSVAAALELFASVALLFWYVLRLLMAFSND